MAGEVRRDQQFEDVTVRLPMSLAGRPGSRGGGPSSAGGSPEHYSVLMATG